MSDCDSKGVATKRPLSMEIFYSSSPASSRDRSGSTGDDDSRRNERDSSGKPGLWTGSREGIVSTVIAFSGALLFGGAAGIWFSPGESGWVIQALVIALGSMVMALLVSLCGT